MGELLRVSLVVEAKEGAELPRRMLLEESLPAGLELVERSISGDVLHHQRVQGGLTLYLEARNAGARAEVSYDLHARVPGRYRVLPALAWPVSYPQRVSASAQGVIEVLSRASGSGKAARTLTPDEHFHLASLMMERGELMQAEPHVGELTRLVDGGAVLRPDADRRLSLMALELALKRKDAGEVVRRFEAVFERYPDVVLPGEQILGVGAAYRDLEEYERAFQVYRGVMESGFLHEASAGGKLQQGQEMVAAIKYLRSLVRSYPDLQAVLSVQYSMAQMLREVAQRADRCPELVEKGYERRRVLATARELLVDFLVQHPSSSLADEAGFALAGLALDLDDRQEAARLSALLARAWPESRLFKRFRYLEGFCQAALGHFEEALKLYGEVARAPSDENEDVEDQVADRHLATYAMAQIYQAMGRGMEARETYREAAEHFSEADEALAQLERKVLEPLDRISTARSGKPAIIRLETMNLEEVEARVFRVDLLKYLLVKMDKGWEEESEGEDGGIDVTGLRPAFRKLQGPMRSGAWSRSRTTPCRTHCGGIGISQVPGEPLYSRAPISDPGGPGPSSPNRTT